MLGLLEVQGDTARTYWLRSAADAFAMYPTAGLYFFYCRHRGANMPEELRAVANKLMFEPRGSNVVLFWL